MYFIELNNQVIIVITYYFLKLYDSFI